MNFNVWIDKKASVFIGGDPSKGAKPVITLSLMSPQVLIDTDKGTVTIVETTGANPSAPVKK